MSRLFLLFFISCFFLSGTSHGTYDTCSLCNGSSQIQCSACNSKGCEECNYTGRIECPFLEKYKAFHPSHEENSLSKSDKARIKKITNPDLVDNTEKILKQEARIRSLQEEKKTCFECHGSGKVRRDLCIGCYGTGSMKIGYPPQYFPCSWCGRTGRRETQCSSCFQTNIAINIAEDILTSLKETHGLTKEAEKNYYYIKNRETQMTLDWQREVNAMIDSYIDDSKSASFSSASSSGCSYCNGTGYDSFAYDTPGFGPTTGGYTNPEGSKCPYCSKYIWHQHGFCPHCH